MKKRNLKPMKAWAVTDGRVIWEEMAGDGHDQRLEIHTSRAAARKARWGNERIIPVLISPIPQNPRSKTNPRKKRS